MNPLRGQLSFTFPDHDQQPAAGSVACLGCGAALPILPADVPLHDERLRCSKCGRDRWSPAPRGKGGAE
jgi:hypothetical protein